MPSTSAATRREPSHSDASDARSPATTTQSHFVRGDDWFGQPRGLTFLFLTEMWEKFSFYGMRTLLVYYMIKQLHFTQADASLLYGLYAGGVYLTPVAGGYIGDRWLGRRRAVIGGGVLMALGHFMLTQESWFLAALVMIALGNGLFLPNLPSQVAGLYSSGDPRHGGAYNVYYVGVNVGALLAPLVCGTLGEVYGWHWGFGAAGVGMCLGLLVFVLGRRHLPADAPLGRGVRPKDFDVDASLAPAAPKLAALLLVGLAMVVFRTAYEQSGNTLAVWADRAVDRHVFGWEIPVTWMQALNPLLVFALTPLVIGWWRRQALHGREPAALTKMALGAAGLAFSYLLLALVAWSAAKGSSLPHCGWLLPFFLIYTGAELFILPVGVGLFARLAPRGMAATFIAAWFLASFGGNLLAGFVGGAWASLGPAAFFALMAGVGAVAALMLKATGPLLHRVDA